MAGWAGHQLVLLHQMAMPSHWPLHCARSPAPVELLAMQLCLAQQATAPPTCQEAPLQVHFLPYSPAANEVAALGCEARQVQAAASWLGCAAPMTSSAAHLAKQATLTLVTSCGSPADPPVATAGQL